MFLLNRKHSYIMYVGCIGFGNETMLEGSNFSVTCDFIDGK